MNNYTDLEIENWIGKLLSSSETIGPWGYETDPPTDNDIKSAKMLKQLLDENKDLKIELYKSLKKEFE